MPRSLLNAAWVAAALATAGLAAVPARADISLNVRGSVAYLSSHRLMPGDAEEFAAFLEQPRRVPLRIVYLDSPGGNTQVAIQIGQLIREHGLSTGFHVGRGRCVSACTTMFLGGVDRYYVGGGGVSDGVGTRRGLGFHPSSGGQGGEDSINDYYQRMGVPGAAALRYRVYSRDSIYEGMGPRSLYFAGGNSALRAGVATSTSAPPGLRD